MVIRITMVRKKSNKRKVNSKKGLDKEIEEVEKWIHERKKFFWKLFWVIVLIVGLVTISQLFMRVNGGI